MSLYDYIRCHLVNNDHSIWFIALCTFHDNIDDASLLLERILHIAVLKSQQEIRNKTTPSYRRDGDIEYKVMHETSLPLEYQEWISDMTIEEKIGFLRYIFQIRCFPLESFLEEHLDKNQLVKWMHIPTDNDATTALAKSIYQIRRALLGHIMLLWLLPFHQVSAENIISKFMFRQIPQLLLQNLISTDADRANLSPCFQAASIILLLTVENNYTLHYPRVNHLAQLLLHWEPHQSYWKNFISYFQQKQQQTPDEKEESESSIKDYIVTSIPKPISFRNCIGHSDTMPSIMNVADCILYASASNSSASVDDDNDMEYISRHEKALLLEFERKIKWVEHYNRRMFRYTTELVSQVTPNVDKLKPNQIFSKALQLLIEPTQADQARQDLINSLEGETKKKLCSTMREYYQSDSSDVRKTQDSLAIESMTLRDKQKYKKITDERLWFLVLNKTIRK